LINKVLFKRKGDDGIYWTKYYDSFPTAGFTLALTVIKCAIDEWASGYHEIVTLKENKYSRVFRSHLTSLEEFKKMMSKLGLLTKLLQNIYKNRCVHAGVA
ncbi:hypothetical protein HD554DRAFT_1999059, partial [Boletus coccyginus]